MMSAKMKFKFQKPPIYQTLMVVPTMLLPLILSHTTGRPVQLEPFTPTVCGCWAWLTTFTFLQNWKRHEERRSTVIKELMLRAISPNTANTAAITSFVLSYAVWLGITAWFTKYCLLPTIDQITNYPW